MKTTEPPELTKHPESTEPPELTKEKEPSKTPKEDDVDGGDFRNDKFKLLDKLGIFIGIFIITIIVLLLVLYFIYQKINVSYEFKQYTCDSFLNN